MTGYYSDTDPEIENAQLEMLRHTPAWRKFELLGQLNEAVRALAMSGLRQRNPDADPQMLRRMLADLLLGEELAARAYGERSDAG